jgi:hypothetical protein
MTRAPMRYGLCQICGKSRRLRKSGKIGGHPAQFASVLGSYPPCGGTDLDPVPYDPNKCGECMELYYGTPGIREAIWSVAIESPKSGDQLAWEFLEIFHETGHNRREFLGRMDA